ncbi:hypothetical protein RCH15_003722, partial [Arthrobacter sp. MP_M4]|nr:hypothetical protein [Arthrobacter sp. MP_M4]
TGASKDHPPGWTSPMGRRYPSESQDWEPPRWPGPVLTQDLIFDVEPPPDQEPEFDPDLTPDDATGQDFDLDLPEGPFPDLFSAA